MKKMYIYCKIWNVDEKKTDKGHKYLSVCFTESFKDTEGNWQSSYEYLTVWEGGKNPTLYTNLKSMLDNGTIKTVKQYKKDATRVVLNVMPKIGKSFKTGEPIFEYTYFGIELDKEGRVSTEPKKNMYDNVAPAEEKKDEEELNWDAPF